MRMSSFVVWCCLVSVLLHFNSLIGQDEFKQLELSDREWTVHTDSGAEKLKGRINGLKAGTIEFVRPDGQIRSVALSQLSPDDRRAALIDRVGSGVVVINTKDVFDQPAGMGSGFLVNVGGLIVTCYHVIAGAGDVEITFRDSKETYAADVLSVDRDHDIAFLRVAKIPQGTQVIEIQSQTMPVPGNTVWTLGHPNHLVNTAGWGQVSAIRKTEGLPENIQQILRAPLDSQWLQTTAVLAEGSSGGPLLNERGQAIGINTFLLSPQLGFAIHVSHARDAYLNAKTATPMKLPTEPSENEDPLGWVSSDVAPLLKAYGEAIQQFQEQSSRLSEKEAIERVLEIRRKFFSQFLKFAEQHKGSWGGFQSLCYAAQAWDVNADAEAFKLVCDLVSRHHNDARQLTPFMKMVAEHDCEITRDFFRSIHRSSPDTEVRFGACVALGASLFRWLQSPDTIAIEQISKHRQEIGDLCKSLQQISNEFSENAEQEDVRQIADQMNQLLETSRLGMPAIETTGVDIEGNQFGLDDYKGKVVLLDFFANWCPHCRRMYPDERDMVKAMKSRPFALLGVHCENQRELHELIQDEQVTWRCWADGDDGPIAGRWEVESFPTLVLLDHKGIVRWQVTGAPDEATLHKHIEQLLLEAERDIE